LRRNINLAAYVSNGQIVLKNSEIFCRFADWNFDLNFILLISQISKIRFDDSTTPIVFMPELIPLSVLRVLAI